jgi:hypothetical protein
MQKGLEEIARIRETPEQKAAFEAHYASLVKRNKANWPYFTKAARYIPQLRSLELTLNNGSRVTIPIDNISKELALQPARVLRTVEVLGQSILNWESIDYSLSAINVVREATGANEGSRRGGSASSPRKRRRSARTGNLVGAPRKLNRRLRESPVDVKVGTDVIAVTNIFGTDARNGSVSVFKKNGALINRATDPTVSHEYFAAIDLHGNSYTTAMNRKQTAGFVNVLAAPKYTTFADDLNILLEFPSDIHIEGSNVIVGGQTIRSVRTRTAAAPATARP